MLKNKKIAIDLGTVNLLIFVLDIGVTVNEPSVVAIDSASGEVVAIGSEARKMLGKTPDSVIASHPLQDGVIADYHITQAMIEYYINKVMGKFRLYKPDVMVSVPAGATSTEIRAVIDATLAAGAKAAYIIKEPIAAAIGAGMPIASAAGNMIVDIGGGTTEVAIISLGGIVAQNSIRVGGNEINNSITDYVRRKYSLAIGENTAEEVKKKFASAVTNTKSKKVEIRGRSIVAGLPKTISIEANELTGAIQDELEKIISAIKKVLEQTPPELSSDIIDRGMILTGGGALLKNLDRLLTKVTGIPCIVAEKPLTCVVRGAGAALNNLEEYKRNLMGIK